MWIPKKWIPKKWIHQNNSNSSAFQNIYIYINVNTQKWIPKSGYPKVDTPKQLKFLSFSKHMLIHKCGYPNVDTQKVDTPKQLKFLSFSKHIYINVDTQKWIPKQWIHQNNSNSSAFQNIYVYV